MTIATMTRPRHTIAMFSESYLPRISGVTHSLDAMTRALRGLGHRVLIAAPRYAGHVDTDPDVVRFPSVRPPRERGFPLGLPYSSAAWRRLDDADPDVVHAHSPFIMGAAGARLARRRGRPLIFTHHTLYDEYVHYAPFVSARISAPAVRAYVRSFANRCQAVVVPSRMVAARLRDQGVTARLETIPTAALEPGLIDRVNRRWARETFHLPPGRPVIVTASRLAHEKSVELVLDAFAAIRRAHRAVLLVVGGGPEETALRDRAVSLGISDDTVFTGLLPHPRALDCMAAGDIFLYASQTETQGLVVVEAMAIGLPVVAVGAGGIPDAVRDGETGYLTPPDPAALAARTRILLDDPERARVMGERGRAASGAFTMPVVAAQLVELYGSLLVSASRNARPER